jgi:hypothetical protein
MAYKALRLLNIAKLDIAHINVLKENWWINQVVLQELYVK